ncbi:MAG: metalloregulator ArsR/SmtB family transcription factor [Candidatus Hydromicrobium sp.]|nr:metalloregulator ArsR/SmtB family transcription factor [Candidatus Hydromicrobium sp.]
MQKENFYNLHADICKTISNPRRQAIIDTIRKSEMTVSKLIKKTGISQANLSQHLTILRAKGVVRTRREGNNIYYSIANLKIIKAYDLISEVLRESISFRNKTVTDAFNHNQ